MNILLITGASGFVGRHAVQFGLADSKYAMVLASDAVDLPYIVDPAGKAFCFFKADLTKPEDLAELRNEFYRLWGYSLTVWHIGGCFNYSASYDLLYRVNVLGTRNLMEMLCSLGVGHIRRFVFWSGGVLYGKFDHPQGKLPADEQYPVNPQNGYGWSKKEAEDWIMFFHRKEGLPTTIMRLPAIYGPGASYGLATAFFLNARGVLPPILIGNPHNKTPLIHVEDVIRVADFLSGVPESNGEIYNVTDYYGSYPVEKVAKLIGEQLNNGYGNFSLPAWILKVFIALVQLRAKQLSGQPLIDPELGHMSVLNAWMSNAKLLSLLSQYGFSESFFKYPDGLKGIIEVIQWYKKEGKL